MIFMLLFARTLEEIGFSSLPSLLRFILLQSTSVYHILFYGSFPFSGPRPDNQWPQQYLRVPPKVGYLHTSPCMMRSRSAMFWNMCRRETILPKVEALCRNIHTHIYIYTYVHVWRGHTHIYIYTYIPQYNIIWTYIWTHLTNLCFSGA